MSENCFKYIEFNTTEQIKKGGLFSRIIGKNDLIFIRNKYQTEIDNSWAALMNMAHYLETSESAIQTICLYNEISATLGQVKDMKRKADILYDKVADCIRQDQAFSERMWGIHQKMFERQPGHRVNVSTSFENVQVTHEALVEYVKQYPHIEIQHDIQMIKQIENEITDKKDAFRRSKALLRDYFEQFKLELIKCESKYDAYVKICEEGKAQITSCKFRGSFIYNLMDAEQKHKLEIDTTMHRLDQVSRTIAHYQKIKENVEQNKYEVKMENVSDDLNGEFADLGIDRDVI